MTLAEASSGVSSPASGQVTGQSDDDGTSRLESRSEPILDASDDLDATPTHANDAVYTRIADLGAEEVDALPGRTVHKANDEKGWD